MPPTQEEKITVRQKGIHGQGVAPDHALAIPEALYRCENADAGIDQANDHYVDGGCFPASELVHARFEIKEHETVYGGYFCTGCLDSLGIKRRGPTLQQALASNTLNKVCHALGITVPGPARK